MTDEMWLELAKGQFRFEDNPTEEQLNAKVQELKNVETARENKKASGKQKLKDLGLDDDEIQALIGV
tara:strand:+ start:475 stop:675 length:201 start_codon:yes stop_codon:yes gene_type:complete